MRLYSYQSASEVLTGRNKDSRKLMNNTYLHRVNDSSIVIKLHSTDVVTYHADGRIVFNSGGWRTVTTKARMNEYSPARVSQARGVWSISIGGVEANYADGITWDGSAFTGAGVNFDAVKLARRASKYATDYMAAFDAGKVPLPGPGDCWGCLMVAEDGKAPMGGKDHMLSHMAEKYYVPSLLSRAIERFPVSMAAKAYISDKWAAGTDHSGWELIGWGWWARIGKEQARKSLYRYVKAELGLAA